MELINQLIKEGKITIIDIRNLDDYEEGHLQGSINIPLQTLPSNVHRLKELAPIVVCSNTNRIKHVAKTYLMQQGIETYVANFCDLIKR